MMPEPHVPSLADEALPLPVTEWDRNRYKSRAAIAANHDFRTPLNIVLISAQMLKTHGPQISEEKRLTYLQRIEDAVKQMTALLDELLATETR